MQQLGAAYQAQCRLFAHLGFFFIGQARGHRSGGHKHGGQMAKVQSADQQTRHDLVAHAQHQGAVKHIVAQGHGSGHGNGVAREQAQLHARRALGDAIAHGGHAAGHLGRGAPSARLVFDDVRVMLQRRMGREHVVVGVDDGDIGRALPDHLHRIERTGAALVCRLHGGKSVGHVGATHALRARRARGHSQHLRHILGARGRTARDDALTDSMNNRMQCHDEFCNWVTRLMNAHFRCFHR